MAGGTGGILRRDFYARPAPVVARDLLGKVLVRRFRGWITAGRIVEAEAYLGEEDPASHAYRGKTRRNAVMFGPAGFAYVYFTYGNHHCLNAVTGEDGTAGAVLIRALEPLDGIETMRRRRGVPRRVEDLANGPGKLCQALAVNLKLNGETLSGNRLWIEERDGRDPGRIVRTGRVGISRAADRRFRFFLKDSAFVSMGVPGPAKRRKRGA